MASIERRVRGDGTVAFRVVWRDPTQPGRQSLTFDDRRQAEQTIKLLDANSQRLTLAVEVANAIRQGGPTVEDAVREHIELLNRVGEDTRTGYRLRARDHITPYLGALPVKALTWQQVTLWIRELQNKGLSHKTIANVHGLLSAAMNTAVRLGYRADNPCAAVRLPRNQRAGDEMVVLEPEELDLILDNLIEHYRPFIITLVGTGMRFGEATALHVEDLSLDAHPPTIRINKAWKQDGDRQPFIGAPKSARSRRTISLSPDLAEMLRELAVGRRRTDLVFVNVAGRPIRNNTFWATHWTPAITNAQNPVDADGSPDPDARRLTKRPRIHDLRHTHASWMLAEGMEMFTLSRRLGHETYATTDSRYSHLMPAQQLVAANVAAAAMGRLRRRTV
ncbi:MAG: site-specific integrase [Phycicoccus sp.]|nr:site-specific integrase [Phycicoccus sp.]